MKIQPNRAWLVSLLILILSGGNAAMGQVDDIEFFETKIRPIFSEYCSDCHSAESDPISGGLNLGSREALLTGGDTGPAIVAGDPSKSLLVDAINYRGHYEMPPDSKLPQHKIDLIENWIERGAAWPAHASEEVAVAKSEFDLRERRDAHWAWKSVQAYSPPKTNDAGWCLDPIDHFVLAKLKENGTVI